MRLITQCPACATVFRVVPDQLRISEGWVRCGHCDEVFDGNAHLQMLQDSDDAGGAYTAQTDPVLECNPHTLLTQSDPSTALPEAPLPSVDAAEAAPVSLSFMRPDEGSHPGPASRTKKWMVLLCSLLALLLVAQILVRERDRIAAAVPALHPLLVEVCDWLACTVSAPQQIESIAIEGSAFTNLQEDVYLLHASLKNSAPVALAIPALELTLTDRQDRQLVRRVLGATEITERKSLAAGTELQVDLPIHLQRSADSMPIAGYKLLAFYP